MKEVKLCTEKHIKFEMAKNATLIISRAEAEKCHEENLQDNNVPVEMSDDLVQYWNEISHPKGRKSKSQSSTVNSKKRSRRKASS